MDKQSSVRTLLPLVRIILNNNTTYRFVFSTFTGSCIIGQECSREVDFVITTTPNYSSSSNVIVYFVFHLSLLVTPSNPTLLQLLHPTFRFAFLLKQQTMIDRLIAGLISFLMNLTSDNYCSSFLQSMNVRDASIELAYVRKKMHVTWRIPGPNSMG